MRDATRARAALVALLLASVVLVLLDVRDTSAVGGVRGFVAAVVGPVQRAAGAIAAPFVDWTHSVVGFGDASVRDEQVAADRKRLADGGDAAALGAAEQSAVAGLLAASGLAGYRIVPARVVAYSTAQRFSSAVTLDVGSGSGLANDMAVITGDGLVGRVASVGPNTATVVLICDAGAAVAARLAASLQAGVLRGSGSASEAELQLLDTTAALNEGDRVVTFGSQGGRPYPPGIPVGTVVGFRGDPGQADRVALVRPAAVLGALDIVGVVVAAPPQDARIAVSPPRPTSATGATGAPKP